MPVHSLLKWLIKPGRTQREFKKKILICSLLSLLVYAVIAWPMAPIIELPFTVTMEQYGRFEPIVFQDFNFNTDGKVKVQKIIHQTWKTRTIPSKFIENIRSFVRYNPKWKYYFWTDKSARQLIADFYPQLLSVWDGVMYSRYPIRRADALRYIVLYHYGGLYVDLDVINFRALDNATTKHPCVFTPEPYEHAILQLFTPYVLSNAVMLCSAGHPFLRHLIDNLHTSEYYKDTVDSTGPGYVTTQYQIYTTKNKVHGTNQTMKTWLYRDNTPHLFRDSLHTLTNTSIYIANTQYFMPSMDKRLYSRLSTTCRQFNMLSHLFKEMCVNVKVLGFQSRRNEFSFTEHLWYMTWFDGNSSWVYDKSTSVDIQNIVPYFDAYRGRYEDSFIV